jgi:hypothetical protein
MRRIRSGLLRPRRERPDSCRTSKRDNEFSSSDAGDPPQEAKDRIDALRAIERLEEGGEAGDWLIYAADAASGAGRPADLYREIPARAQQRGSRARLRRWLTASGGR